MHVVISLPFPPCVLPRGLSLVLESAFVQLWVFTPLHFHIGRHLTDEHAFARQVFGAVASAEGY